VRRLLADQIGNLYLATIRMADDLASPDTYKCRAKMRNYIPYQLQNLDYSYLDIIIRTSNLVCPKHLLVSHKRVDEAKQRLESTYCVRSIVAEDI
jgi:hypothetical protein